MAITNFAEIKDIPSLDDYPDIQEAMEKRELVIFTGAGVSRLVGCKSWNELASDLLKKCLDLHLLDYHEFDVINNYSDQKKKISIAYGILKENNKKEFFEVFNNSLSYKENKNEKNIYDYLVLLADTFVTTNSDNCFDKKFIESDIIYDFSQVCKVIKHKLYHIHGVNKDENSLVFTSEQYLSRYNNRDSNGNKIKFLEFLNDLFSNFTVLFIGYGLAEFELLDYLTLKAKSNSASKRHYALMPYYSFEKKIMEHDQLYYDTLNIQIIPYAKDINGYNQIVYIADKWSNKNNFLRCIDTELQDIFTKDKLIKKDCERILNIVSKDDSFLREFLNLCSRKPEFTPILLEYLYQYGFFKPERNCDLLGFLYVYIDYCNKSENYKQIAIFIKIIDENIANFGERKSNFRTDNSLLELIFKLDEKYIDQKYLDFLNNVFTTADVPISSFTLLHKIFPKIISYRNIDYIKQIISITFSYKIIETNYPWIFPKIDFYAMKEIAEKYSEKLLNIVGEDFIRILVDIILRIPDVYIRNWNLKHYDSDKPIIVDYYIPSILNVLVWLLDKIESKENLLNELLEENSTLYNILANTLAKQKEQYKSPYERDAYIVESEYNDDEIKDLSVSKILEVIKKNQSLDIIDKTSASNIVQKWIIDYSSNDKQVFDKLININSYFSNSVIYGLCSLVREKRFERLSNLNDVINYFEQKLDVYLEDRSSDTERGRYNSFCLRNICSFISDYIKNNITNLKKNEYERFIKIIFKIYERLESTSILEGSSFALNTDYLNSESGTCFEALFFLYAYSKEILKERNSELITIFENEIKAKKSTNFLIMLGKNIPYFFYYDEEWVKAQLLELLPNASSGILNVFWSGFYYTPYNISDKFYLYLKVKGFLEQLINLNSSDSEYQKKIADILAIMYLSSVETIAAETILLKVIKKREIKFLDAFIDSFIFRKKILKEKFEQQIVDIWKELISCLSEVNNEPSYESVIIKLLEFVEVVSSVNDVVYGLIHFSIRLIPYYRIDYFMIPSLLDIYQKDESSRRNIEKIIIEFSDVGTFFSDYDDCFSKLFLEIKNFNVEIAKEIANIYMKHNEPKYLNLLKESK